MTFKIHTDLLVYQKAFAAATLVSDLSCSFPKSEQYSLTDQARRSSRSVCANIAEAWRKRRYPLAFIAKLSDAEAEAAETQVWIAFAHHHGYVSEDTFREFNAAYDEILRLIVAMINNPDKWVIQKK